MTESPIALALDVSERQRLDDLVSQTREHVGVFKIGLTTMYALGLDVLDEIGEQGPVFADAKLHDIPAQVEGAMAALARRNVRFVTIHAAGGPDMIKAAVAAAPEGVTVLAVTVLTSLGESELEQIGLAGSPEDAVLRLAELALRSGADGLVCSPLEVARLREELGSSHEGGPLLVVPGIRPAGADAGDQSRTLTPAEAIVAGADLLVVGRPITAAPDPGAAARSLLEEVRA